MTLWMMVLMAIGGIGLAVQSAVNTRLRVSVELPALSALISFVVGGVALLVLHLSGVLGRGRWSDVGTLPWWAWIGGLMGAFYVTAVVIALPRIGSALVIALTILGQLAAGLALDAHGWLGVPKVPLTPMRICGAMLLFGGVFLMQWRR